MIARWGPRSRRHIAKTQAPVLTPRNGDPGIEEAVLAKLDRVHLNLSEYGAAAYRENGIGYRAAGCADGFTVVIGSVHDAITYAQADGIKTVIRTDTLAAGQRRLPLRCAISSRRFLVLG